ncbi:ABC transporter permease [Nonomuraea sp. NPDC050153]|uniref:ABC transporter permease n=1 Tax=Nonomuraea sp. NPDC050153 TaxID=3364359 RepID=UPI0037A50EEF
MSSGVFFVFEYYLVGFRRTWKAALLTTFGLPLLTLLGLGMGVGHYLTEGFDGLPYLHWIVPGLIASTAVSVAVGNSTWPVLAKLSWTGSYGIQLATPLRVADILGGHVAFVLFRVLLSCAGLLIVSAAFGVLRSPSSLLVVPLTLLLALSCAAPTFAFSSSVPSETYFSALTRFVVIPMSLFAGVFFPVETLPAAARLLAYVSPLWSGICLIRSAVQNVATPWPVALHLLYLALWAAAGWLLAHHRFRLKLTG